MSEQKNKYEKRQTNPFLVNTPDPSPQKPGLAHTNSNVASGIKRTNADSCHGSPLKSFQQRETTAHQQYINSPFRGSPLKKSKSASASNSPFTDRFLPRRTDVDLQSLKYLDGQRASNQLRFRTSGSPANRQSNAGRTGSTEEDTEINVDSENQLELQKIKQADQLYDVILKNELFGDKLEGLTGSSNSKYETTKRTQGTLDIIQVSSGSGNSEGSLRTSASVVFDDHNQEDMTLELSPTRTIGRRRRGGRARTVHSRSNIANSVSMPSLQLRRHNLELAGSEEEHASDAVRVRRRLNFARFEDFSSDDEISVSSDDSSFGNNTHFANQRDNNLERESTNLHQGLAGNLNFLKTAEQPRTCLTKRASLLQYSPDSSIMPAKHTNGSLATMKKLMEQNREILSSKATPVRAESKKLLLTPSKKLRDIPKIPYRVLDAPGLADDFYCDMIDWSSQDRLAVVLGKSCFLTDDVTNDVTELDSLKNEFHLSYTGLQWANSGSHLALGLSNGLTQIYDVVKNKCIRTLSGHIDRVSCLSWNNHVLSTGSRDSKILHRDVRSPDQFFETLATHQQEVCGLKWNVLENKLASGGNDNIVCVYDGVNKNPVMKMEEHHAAVKAIAWSPHKRGLLATGGGTADRHLKVWNVNTSLKLKDVDSGSQICNLIWSKNTNEILTSHGFSKFQLTLWDYPTMDPVATLKAHSFRVLHLTLSNDGTTVVSGAGDETLRYWKLFQNMKSRTRGQQATHLQQFERELSQQEQSFDHSASTSFPRRGLGDDDGSNLNSALLNTFKSIR
ncbi:hypothetical protein ACO0QE_002948 [Hanseniaspora vineae]